MQVTGPGARNLQAVQLSEKRDVSEAIGDGVIGFRDQFICKEHVNDAIDVLLRDVVLKH